YVGSLFRQTNTSNFTRLIRSIEQTQLNGRSVLRKQGKIYSGTVPGCAERIGQTGPDSHASSLIEAKSAADRLSSLKKEEQTSCRSLSSKPDHIPSATAYYCLA